MLGLKLTMQKLRRLYRAETRQSHDEKTTHLLQKLMSKYQTRNLVNQSPQEFRARIEAFVRMIDWETEGFRSPERQRDLSVKFHWGHDHDFGDFSVKGRMNERHIWILAAFISEFQALPASANGLRILDVGCWTGGTSLLLSGLGADVIAIDEVKKYIEALKYLKDAFKIDNLEPLDLSLFDCVHRNDFQDAFDYVLFAGALYHVSDPILALRITFNCLKDGGGLLLETAGVNSRERILRYEGPQVFGNGSAEDLNRSGWNWLIPSRGALYQMMEDVGYTDIRVGEMKNGRLLAVGKRKTHVDMMRGGISLRNIR